MPIVPVLDGEVWRWNVSVEGDCIFNNFLTIGTLRKPELEKIGNGWQKTTGLPFFSIYLGSL
jgi:hypothetical protein